MINILLGFVVDVIIVVAMVLAFRQAFRRELPKELIYFGTFILSAALAIVYYKPLATYLGEYVSLKTMPAQYQKAMPEYVTGSDAQISRQLCIVLAFIVIFFASLLISRLLMKPVFKLFPDEKDLKDARHFTATAKERRLKKSITAGVIGSIMVLLYLIVLSPIMPFFGKSLIALLPQIGTPSDVFQMGHSASSDKEGLEVLLQKPISIIQNGYGNSLLLKLTDVLSPLTNILNVK